MWWMVLLGLIVYLGATNIYNFMDGINGITAGNSLAMLVTLAVLNVQRVQDVFGFQCAFVCECLIGVAIMSVLVFCFFNFRPKNKAECFVSDMGSVGMAFILFFTLGFLIMKTGNITYLVFLLVYGVDRCYTIVHRITLHENSGEEYRKHSYQLMANVLSCSSTSCATARSTSSLVTPLCRHFFLIACGHISLIRK